MTEETTVSKLPLRVRAEWKLWSVQNRIKGYKFGPIQRFRCCDHTTPFHYAWCPRGDNRE